MKIVLLGAGNVATVLGKMATAAGHTILQVYNRHLDKAAVLATKLGAEAADDLNRLSTEADLYILAVSDSAVADLAKQLNISKGMLVHTAGSVPLATLSAAAKNTGVLYPFQSLRASRLPTGPFPFLVDANSPDVLQWLSNFAQTLSPMLAHCNEEQRIKLHLSAVLVNNFSNHLFTLAKDYCQQQAVDFSLLVPIIKETAERLESGPPTEWQTGPAVRNDEATMQQHLQLLEAYPELAAIYRWFSQSIQQYYSGS